MFNKQTILVTNNRLMNRQIRITLYCVIEHSTNDITQHVVVTGKYSRNSRTNASELKRGSKVNFIYNINRQVHLIRVPKSTEHECHCIRTSYNRTLDLPTWSQTL